MPSFHGVWPTEDLPAPSSLISDGVGERDGGFGGVSQGMTCDRALAPCLKSSQLMRTVRPVRGHQALLFLESTYNTRSAGTLHHTLDI